MTNINDADAGQLYSNQTTIHLQEAPGLMGLVNRAWEAEVTSGRGHKTTIQDVDFSYFGSDFVRESDATMGSPETYQAATSIGLKQIEFILNKLFDTKPVEVYEYDEWGVPIDLDPKAQAKVANELDLKISQFIATYWKGLGTFSTYEPAAADLPKEDVSAGKGPNNNAGNIFNHGMLGTVATDTDNSVGISGDKSEATFGDLKGTNALTVVGKAIYDMLRRSRRRMEHIYLMNGNQIGDAPGSLWAVADPAVWDAYAAYYRETFKTELSALIPAGFDGREAPRIFGGEAYQGRSFGHDLISYASPNFQPGQANKAAKASGFPIFIGTNMGVTFAMRAVQTAIDPKDRLYVGKKIGVKSMAQHTYGGIQLVNAPCMTKATVVSVS